jgi:hypothetical protein
MCTCASCEYTDAFSGAPDLFGELHVQDIRPVWSKDGLHVEARETRVIPGFNAWPRGKPAGYSSSAAAYKAHAAHCGSSGLPRPWQFKPGLPPKFNTAGLVMPIQPAPKLVLEFINSVKRPELWDCNKPKPAKRVSDFIQLARDLRAKHRAELKALKAA